MPKCAVATCKVAKSLNKKIMLHRFPKQVNLQKKWINVCGRVDNINVNTGESRYFIFFMIPIT